MPPKASSKSAAISLNSSQTQLLCLVIQHGGITQPSKEKWEVIAKALGIVKGDPVNAAQQRFGRLLRMIQSTNYATEGAIDDDGDDNEDEEEDHDDGSNFTIKQGKASPAKSTVKSGVNKKPAAIKNGKASAIKNTKFAANAAGKEKEEPEDGTDE